VISSPPSGEIEKKNNGGGEWVKELIGITEVGDPNLWRPP
jgi:hypothetical protein